MRQKHVQRKSRLLTRAVLCLLATLIVLPIFTFRPHFGQTTFDYGDALEKAIWFFDANKCGPNAATDNVPRARGRRRCATAHHTVAASVTTTMIRSNVLTESSLRGRVEVHQDSLDPGPVPTQLARAARGASHTVEGRASRDVEQLPVEQPRGRAVRTKHGAAAPFVRSYW